LHAASPFFKEQGDPKRMKFASFAETFEHEGLNPHAQVELPLSDDKLKEQPGPVALFLNRRFQGKAKAEAISDTLDLAGEWASYTCLDSNYATVLDKVNVASALCRLVQSIKNASVTSSGGKVTISSNRGANSSGGDGIDNRGARGTSNGVAYSSRLDPNN
jgi:hypothetical protein